jgi:curved DNA-binding protein
MAGCMTSSRWSASAPSFSPDVPADAFIDYYELMQISPNAEFETIQRVYRMLAARYHPDNPETGSVEKFHRLQEAYGILSDSEARAVYDLHRQSEKLKPLSIFLSKDFAIGIDGEANRRLGILCLLYNKRRSAPDEPGISLLDLESLMAVPREHLVFTLWYLGEKEAIRRDEKSNYVITSDGIDYVESNLSSNRILRRLLTAAETGEAKTGNQEVHIGGEAGRA